MSTRLAKSDASGGKRILFVSAKAGFLGGVERYIYDVASLLAENGYLVSGLFTERARDFEIFTRPFSQVFFPGDIASMLGKEKFDLAFLHKMTEPELIGSLRGVYPTAVFVHDHDYYCPRRHKYFPLCRINCSLPFNPLYCSLCCGMITRVDGRPRLIKLGKIYRVMREIRKCDAFVVMSDFMLKNLIMNRFPPNAVYKIPPFIQVSPQPRPFTATDRKPTVVYVGQLVKGKGVDLMLAALAKVDADFRALILGGSNHEAAPLKRLAEDLGIAGKVEFLGWQSEPERFLRQADVAVFPSRWQEPFGLTGIEALSQGVPVVGFDVGGVSEWLHDHVNGYLAPPGSVSALGEAIQSLVQAPDIAARLGENGRQMVKQHFSPENFIAGFDHMLYSMSSKSDHARKGFRQV